MTHSSRPDPAHSSHPDPAHSFSGPPTHLILTLPAPLSGPPTRLIMTPPTHFLARPLSHPGPARSRLAPPTPGLLAASLTQPKTRTYLSGPDIKGSITISCVSSLQDRPAGFIQQSLPA